MIARRFLLAQYQLLSLAGGAAPLYQVNPGAGHGARVLAGGPGGLRVD